MTIHEIITRHPHLADVFKFYEKNRLFHTVVLDLLSKKQPALLTIRKGYLAGEVTEVFRNFTALVELPKELLAPLQRAMEVGDIDLTRVPLHEVPAFSLPYPEDDLSMLLFLLSKPYFSWLRDSVRLYGQEWLLGRCPVCSGQPAFSSIAVEGYRRLHCSYCGNTGKQVTTGCTVCLSEETSQLHMLGFEGEEGFKITACDNCKSYVKAVELRVLPGIDPDIADLMSLPIDFVVQEKGFFRRAPNPIGMLKMTING